MDDMCHEVMEPRVVHGLFHSEQFGRFDANIAPYQNAHICREDNFCAGLVSGWPAMRLWKGDAGIQYLIAKTGTSSVEVMVAPIDQSAIPSFGGDMERLQLLNCSLSSFLDGTLLTNSKAGAADAGPLLLEDTKRQLEVCLYLAQCPISVWEMDPKTGTPIERQGPLSALSTDFTIPALVPASRLTQINFWANLHAMKSSLHYDPYNNLLCVVQGQKKVRVAPPSSYSRLDLNSVCDESANHAVGDLWGVTDQMMADLGAKEFIVSSGDVLYIPEGWIHQVQSDSGTLAVNFWWRSSVTAQFGGEMDCYYLRRLVSNRISAMRLKILKEACENSYVKCLSRRSETGQQEEQSDEDPSGQGDVKESTMNLDPQLCSEERYLLERVIEYINDDMLEVSVDSLMCNVEPLILSLLYKGASSLIRVLISLRNSYPRSTSMLISYSTPLMWEALTIGLEDSVGMDELLGKVLWHGSSSEDVLSSFYEHLYSCVDDRLSLTKVILRAKTEAAHKALERVCMLDLGLTAATVNSLQ